jgi:hypothetical protein
MVSAHRSEPGTSQISRRAVVNNLPWYLIRRITDYFSFPQHGFLHCGMCPSPGSLKRVTGNSTNISNIRVLTHNSGRAVRFNVAPLGNDCCRPPNISRNGLLRAQGPFMTYCRCKEVVKLFRFLLSLFSVTGTCNCE